MEFALTPVPGTLNKRGNIYQSTKLVTDQQYFSKLKQFDQRTSQGVLNRKGRFVEGVFVGSSLERENVYQVATDKLNDSSHNQLQMRSIDDAAKGPKFTLIESNHIPYDPMHVAFMKLMERQRKSVDALHTLIPSELTQDRGALTARNGAKKNSLPL